MVIKIGMEKGAAISYDRLERSRQGASAGSFASVNEARLECVTGADRL
jgi:hypothetical protein